MGIGDWGLGPIPYPQSPIPNPQSPFQIEENNLFKYFESNYIYNSIIINRNELFQNINK